jgi:hypothetical protein
MTRNTETLPQLATKIHKLEKKTIASTIEIGRLLQVAWDSFEHGDRTIYHEWIEDEFAWSERTARRFRELSEFQIGHSVQFGNLNVSLTALYFLVDFSKASDLPEPWVKAAIEEVIRQAKKVPSCSQKRITHRVVLEIVNEHVAKLEAKQAELDAAGADVEPEPDAYVEPADAEPADVELDVDADAEPDAEPDEPPPPANELSEALRVIGNHNAHSPLWRTTTRLIDAIELQGVIDTLHAVAAQYYGSDAMKVKADRAEARSRATQHWDLAVAMGMR